MRFKVGDRVRIRSFDWFRNEGANKAVVSMTKYYGEVVTIKSVHKRFYHIEEDGGCFCWIDEMFECKMEEETKSHNNMCKQLIDEMNPNVEVNVKTKPELNFKVGDKVRIKSVDWYIMNKDKDGFVHCGDSVFDNYMSVFCGSVVTIGGVSLYGYDILEDMHCRTWTDEMIEGLVEEETKPELKFKVGDRVIVRDTSGIWEITNVEDNILYTIKRENHTFTLTTYGGFLTLYEGISDKMIECEVEEETKNWADTSIPDGPYTVTYDSPSMNDSMSKNNIHNEIILPKGYIFKDENGNVINATKIAWEKKKKEYPKTYDECCYVLGFENTEMVFEDDYRDINPPKEQWKRLGLMNQFNKLLICRDAYWKIAGEEMRLGKPWEPDWNTSEPKYVISCTSNGIEKQWETTYCKVLAFPTEEMRDAFYEAFKKEIEICKELL